MVGNHEEFIIGEREQSIDQIGFCMGAANVNPSRTRKINKLEASLLINVASRRSLPLDVVAINKIFDFLPFPKESNSCRVDRLDLF